MKIETEWLVPAELKIRSQAGGRKIHIVSAGHGKNL